MKKCFSTKAIAAILAFGMCGLAQPIMAEEEKRPSEGLVSLDNLKWKGVLEPSKGGYLAEIFVINAEKGLGGPFVNVRSDGSETELALEAVFTHSVKKSSLRLSIKGAPTMSSGIPAALVMRSYFQLPERLTEGDYLLCAPQNEFTAVQAKDFWQAKGGLLLRITKK